MARPPWADSVTPSSFHFLILLVSLASGEAAPIR
ncbi:protein of unknown function [Agreia sp. COWG]|nr:protein of unknown function [Agreia sp. COWG]